MRGYYGDVHLPGGACKKVGLLGIKGIESTDWVDEPQVGLGLEGKWDILDRRRVSIACALHITAIHTHAQQQIRVVARS